MASYVIITFLNQTHYVGRLPEKQDWVTDPTGKATDFMVIGLYGSSNTIQYVQGNQPEQLNDKLKTLG